MVNAKEVAVKRAKHLVVEDIFYEGTVNTRTSHGLSFNWICDSPIPLKSKMRTNEFLNMTSVGLPESNRNCSFSATKTNSTAGTVRKFTHWSSPCCTNLLPAPPYRTYFHTSQYIKQHDTTVYTTTTNTADFKRGSRVSRDRRVDRWGLQLAD